MGQQQRIKQNSSKAVAKLKICDYLSKGESVLRAVVDKVGFPACKNSGSQSFFWTSIRLK